MSTDLQENPSGIYDDEEKRAKEQERLKNLEDDFEKPAISDEDRNAGGSSDNPTDLKAKEKELSEKKLKDKKSENKSSSNKEESAGGFFRNTGKSSKGRFSIKGGLSSTKNRIAFGAAAAIVSALALMITWLPNFLINNLKEVLLGRVSSVQMFHQRRYRQKKFHKLKNWFSADGRRAQTVIDEMKFRGYDINFNKSGDLIGLTNPNRTFSATGEGIAKEIDQFLEKRHPFRTARWKTKRMEAFYRKFGVKRTSPVAANKIRAGPDGEINVTRTVNGEIYDGVAEGEKVNLDELDVDRTGEPDDPEAEARRQGVDADLDQNSSEIRKIFDADIKKLEAGADVSELSEEFQTLLRSGGGLNAEVGDIAKRLSSKGALQSFGSTVKDSLSPLDFADRLCITRNRINGAVKLARAAKAIKLIRYAMLFVNAADDSRRGAASAAAIGVLMQRVTSKDSNGQSIGASPGFGYLMKNKFSKSKNNAFKAPVAVDGTPSGFFGGLNSAFNQVPFMKQACPFVQNPFAQFGVGLGAAASNFFAPGSASVTKEAVQTAIKKAVSSFTVRSVAIAVGQSIAIDLAFDQIMSLTEAYIQKELTIPFTGQEKGGELGDILVAGAGASNKQRSLEAGMVPATTGDYAQANTEYLAWKKEEDSNKSFMDRTFAMDDTNTLMFNLAVSMPMNGRDAITDGLNKSLSVASSALNPSKVITSIMTSITPKASALDGDEIAFDEFTVETGSESGKKLATDPAGNPQVILRQDIEDIDPVKNEQELVAAGEIDAQKFEPKKDSGFAYHIEKCIDTPDIYTSIEEDEGDCMARKDITKKYKAQLAFLDLKDGMEGYFFPDEIESGDPGSNSDSTSASGSNTGGQIIGDPYTDTTSIPCAEGTKDIGLQDAYVKGNLFKSRMCSVSNLPSGGQADNPGSSYSTAGADGHAIVNSRVSGAWYKLIQDATNAGINFRANSSFRSMPHQQSLWNNNPNSKLVARPGFSSHQAGVAIDFSNMGGKVPGASCGNRATNSGDGYKWLRENANKYGFKQYAAEAWHWDALNAANRC